MYQITLFNTITEGIEITYANSQDIMKKIVCNLDSKYDIMEINVVDFELKNNEEVLQQPDENLVLGELDDQT